MGAPCALCCSCGNGLLLRQICLLAEKRTRLDNDENAEGESLEMRRPHAVAG